MEIDRFSQVVALIYDAALSADRWDAVLGAFCELFSCPMGQVSYFESFSDPNPVFRVVGFDPDHLEGGLWDRYRALSQSDPRYPPTNFKPYHCRQVVSDEVLHASAIYQQALAPGGVEYTMSVFLNFEADAKCIVGLMRGPGLSAFTADDCEDFGRFVPHIARAVVMHTGLRRARDLAVAAQALVDRVPMGMIVLQDERIVLANAAASELFDQGDGLRRRGGGLSAATAQGQASLAAALHLAMRNGGEPVGLTLPAGDSGQLRVVVSRLEPASAERLSLGPEAVALYVSDSRRPLETREEMLRRLFGLTEREAEVLSALVQGHDTREIAARLGVGVETVKTHLQHIMQALGVRRQAALVKLVLSSPAWIAAPYGEAPVRS